MRIEWNKELYHYGMPRRSGRYKWGSGEDPYHHGASSPSRKTKRLEQRVNRMTSAVSMNKKAASNRSNPFRSINNINAKYYKRKESKYKQQLAKSKATDEYKSKRKENKEIFKSRLKETDKKYTKRMNAEYTNQRQELDKRLNDAKEKYKAANEKFDSAYNKAFDHDAKYGVGVYASGKLRRTHDDNWNAVKNEQMNRIKVKDYYRKEAIDVVNKRKILDKKLSDIEDSYWGERSKLRSEYRKANRELKRARKAK